MTVRESFRSQSRACAKLGSPFMGRLMALCAERLTRETAVGAQVLDWPGDPRPNADNVSLRLAGGLHALKLEELALTDVYPPAEADDDALWTAVETAMTTHEARLLDWLTRAPQTNEVRRAGVIAPALALIAAHYDKPLALIELGTSGGLNLRSDLFRVRANDRLYGPEDSPVALAPDWTGPAPQPHPIRIASRTGIDLSPIDPTTPEGRLRLLAYLWPDQPDRLARTEAAIAIAGHAPATLITGDAADGLSHALADLPPDTVPVVFHTVAWQYFPHATADRCTEILAAPPGPHARVGLEADATDRGAGLTLTLDGTPHDLGRADFHGRWIEWHGLP